MERDERKRPAFTLTDILNDFNTVSQTTAPEICDKKETENIEKDLKAKQKELYELRTQIGETKFNKLKKAYHTLKTLQDHKTALESEINKIQGINKIFKSKTKKEKEKELTDIKRIYEKVCSRVYKEFQTNNIADLEARINKASERGYAFLVGNIDVQYAIVKVNEDFKKHRITEKEKNRRFESLISEIEKQIQDLKTKYA